MPETQPTAPPRRGGCLRPILIVVLLAGAAVGVWRMFVVQRFIVPASVTYMSPALKPGERASLDRLSYHITGPHRGDIVAVAAPGTQLGFDILRVVAMPGEMVEVKAGVLMVDGAAVAESYARGALAMTLEPQRVPRGRYFVLADDRAAYSARNLRWGLVPGRDIIGRIVPAGE